MLEEILGFLAQAETPPSPKQPPPDANPCGQLGGLFPVLIILFVIMYVFMILPQRRREKQRQRMISALKKNDHILTIGGLYGVITSVKDDRITIRVDDNKDVKVTVAPSAVASVVTRGKEEGEKEETEER